MQAKYDKDIIELRKKHEVEISDLKNKHLDDLSDLKLKYDDELRAKSNELSNLQDKYDTDLKNKSLELSDFLAKFDNDIKEKDEKIADLKARHEADMNTKKYEIENLTHSLNTNIEVLSRTKDLLSSKDETISNLSTKVKELTDLNDSLTSMKDSFDDQLNSFKTIELGELNLKLKSALNEVAFKDNEIQSLSNDLKISNNKISEYERQLVEAKNRENQANLKLANTLSLIDDKNVEIQSLSAQIASQNEEILDLKNNLVNKDNLVALQRELDSRDVALRQKDVQIQLLKEKSVSREEYSKMQDQLSEKDLHIQRLNEVKDLFYELSDNAFVDNQSSEGIIGNVSPEEQSLMELENIKKELEMAKENKARIQAADDAELEKLGDILTPAPVEEIPKKVIEESLTELNQGNVEEIQKLKEEIEDYKSSIDELQKIKEVYDKLTAPQLNGLNSIQSQIYHLLPEEAMDTLSVKEYLNEIAFENLSFGNTKNILKSLERKGYIEVAKKENDIYYWKKLPLTQ